MKLETLDEIFYLSFVFTWFVKPWRKFYFFNNLKEENGIDIEPEFKKLEDIKKEVDRCLKTYQDSIDREIGLDKKFKFLKN